MRGNDQAAIRNLLGKCTTFRGLSPPALDRLVELVRHRSFAAGSLLMRQGEPSDALHVIASGRVAIERTHPALLKAVVLAELSSGAAIGDLRVLERAPCATTARALEPTETLEIGAEALTLLLAQVPDAALLNAVSRRAETIDELVDHLLSRHARRSGSSKPRLRLLPRALA
jgi:CRP-like cAMP-binding protein